MLTKLVQHCILVLCKVKHSLLNLFNTRPNGCVVKAHAWNIVDMTIHLVFGPKTQMLDIVDMDFKWDGQVGPGHSGQTMFKMCNANMCNITKCFLSKSLKISFKLKIFCLYSVFILYYGAMLCERVTVTDGCRLYNL